MNQISVKNEKTENSPSNGKSKIKKILTYRKAWTILLVEWLGTFVMTFWIILPSSAGFDSLNNWWDYIWTLMFMKALWVAGFILLLIYLLRGISVNLNPTVTIAEMAKGNDSVPLGLLKINMQFVGGIMAGFLGLQVAIWSHNPGSSLDAISPVWRHYDYAFGENWYQNPVVTMPWSAFNSGGQAIFVIFTMFIEFVLTYLLIGSIFYFQDKDGKSRPLVIFFTLWVIVTIGIRTNDIALNPARLVGPAIAHNVGSDAGILTSPVDYTSWMWVYLISEFAAAAFFSLIELNKNNKLKI